MNGPQITVVGHLAWPPRARTLAGGTVVADFRVATTPRRYDKSTNSWTDLETLWFGVTCWRTLAEHVALSLKKGDRVVVTGRLSMKSYTNDKGEERSGLEIDASSVGMDLLRGPVVQTRLERSQPAAADPWMGDSGQVDPVTGEVLGEPASLPDQVAA